MKKGELIIVESLSGKDYLNWPKGRYAYVHQIAAALHSKPHRITQLAVEKGLKPHPDSACSGKYAAFYLDEIIEMLAYRYINMEKKSLKATV